MSTALTTTAPKPGLLASMASRYNVEPAKFMATLKATVMPSNKPVSDEEFLAFCAVAYEYGLNPLTKEIYAFPDKRGGITPVVGVDGWVKLMNRQETFDGIEFDAKDDEAGNPHSVTAKVYVKGRSRPVTVTEYFKECQRGTEPWKIAPRRMLRHKALIQASRVAFGFAGIHDEDDAAAMAVNVTPTPFPRQEPKTATAPADAVEVPITPEPAQSAPAPAPENSATVRLAELVTNAGFRWDQLTEWATEQGFEQIDEPTAAKLLQKPKGIVAALAAKFGGAK